MNPESSLSHWIGNSTAFPILNRWHFFNHAGVSPLPSFVTTAMRKFLNEAESAGYLGTHWYQDIEALRHSAAKLINAHPEEIAFVKNTSEGISIVANGIDWQWGDRIVSTSVEYPANIYPWMEVVRTRGAKLIMVEEETDEKGHRAVPIDKILHEAADPKTKLVAISHVEYASGQRHNLARIGAFCHEHKKMLCVDAIQSLGVLPIDVEAMHIDFLSADGHKWLLGPEGAGIFYCKRKWIEHTRPLMFGWMNVVDALDYGNYNFSLRPDAGRFECGSHNVIGLHGLKAAVEFLHTIGTESIANRLHHLTGELVTGLIDKGYSVLSPRHLGEWSGIVSFTSPTLKHDEIFRTLRRDHHIEIALREGRLRVSPHFYNTSEQIHDLITALPDH